MDLSRSLKVVFLFLSLFFIPLSLGCAGNGGSESAVLEAKPSIESFERDPGTGQVTIIFANAGSLSFSGYDCSGSDNVSISSSGLPGGKVLVVVDVMPFEAVITAKKGKSFIRKWRWFSKRFSADVGCR